MRMIVGLGNPGKKYEKTRHNTGFIVINAFLEKKQLSLDEESFDSFYTLYKNGKERIIVVEPQTYMNASGEAVLQLLNYYKIKKENLLVVYDDMDIPVGSIKIKEKGSSGGQKGMGNIIELLHTEEIKRIRVGISKNKNIDVVDYVLGKIEKENLDKYNNSIDLAVEAIEYYIKEKNFSKVMNKYNK